MTSVAVAQDGSIYAAAVGANRRIGTTTPSRSCAARRVRLTRWITGAPSVSPAKPLPGGSSHRHRVLVRLQWRAVPKFTGLATDGYPQRSGQLVPTSSTPSPSTGGQPILGTGNKGNIYRVNSDLVSTFWSMRPTQVTAIVSGPGDVFSPRPAMWAKYSRLGPGLEPSGTYESTARCRVVLILGPRILKAELNSGQVRSRHAAEISIVLRTIGAAGASGRQGPSDFSFRPVSPVPADFGRGSLGQVPEVREIEVAYKSRNVAPSWRSRHHASQLPVQSARGCSGRTNDYHSAAAERAAAGNAPFEN